MSRMSKEEFERLKLSRGYSNNDLAIAIQNELNIPYSGDDLIKDFEHSTFLSKAKTGIIRGCFYLLEHKDKLKKIEKMFLGLVLFL
jgi:hypothetical protein